MSDGNINRSLLPHTPFKSGLNAGKTKIRMEALDAFTRFIEEWHKDWTEEQRTDAINNFRKEII